MKQVGQLIRFQMARLQGWLGKSRKEEAMRNKILAAMAALIMGLGIITMVLVPGLALAAPNSANNVTGGGVSLSSSGDVTVNTPVTALRLVKQAWVNISGTWTCKASSVTTAPAGGEPEDRCDVTGPSSVTVPAGTTVKFLIYVRNRTDVVLTDVRFNDVLDTSGAGFTYTGGGGFIRRTAAGQLDTAAIGPLFTNADVACAGAGPQCMTDAADGDIASSVAGTISAGAPTNATLTIPARETVAILFYVTKN